MIINYDLLYNGKEKSEFIEKYDDGDVENKSKYTIYGQFLRIAEEEKKKNKDVYEMSFSELKELFLGCQFSSVTSAVSHISTYKRYSVGNNASSGFNGISVTKMAEEVVAKDRDKRYSKKEIDEALGRLVNATDKALVLSIFEGVRGKEFSEMANLKFVSIDNKEVDGKFFVTLKDDGKNKERGIYISKQLKNLLEQANRQEAYENPATLRTSPFENSPYIFKKSSKGRESDDSRIGPGFIGRKMAVIKEAFGNAHLKTEDIFQSGMMYMAYQIFKEKGFINREDLDAIGEHYGLTKTFLAGNEFGFNITTLKRKIFHPSVKDIYPDLAMEIQEVK